MATVEKKPRAETGSSKVGELLDRQPPRSIEAERAVIGSLLLLPEACDEVALVVRPDDFYDTAHRAIFGHMLALHDGGRQIDPMLLGQLLKDAGQYETVGGAAYPARTLRRRCPRPPTPSTTPASSATRPCSAR